jgi:thiamine biosynthesis lipoprotein
MSDRRSVFTHHVMGTVASVHVIGHADRDTTAGAVDACFRQLDDLDRIFSTYRSDSEVSRLQRGELALADADHRVAEVFDACMHARTATAGLFDAWQRGWFDPTGYVKGWATEKAATTWLEPLVHSPGVGAVGIGVGGDLQLFTAPGSDWTWRVGIADPSHPQRLVGTVELRDGAVATSGTAERGAHIVDPRTGAPATSVASVTVVADGLSTADLWATTAVIRGFDDLTWITGRHEVLSGLMVARGGRTRRWANGVELAAAETDSGQFPLVSAGISVPPRGV